MYSITMSNWRHKRRKPPWPQKWGCIPFRKVKGACRLSIPYPKCKNVGFFSDFGIFAYTYLKDGTQV
jgi:hypothetical protein